MGRIRREAMAHRLARRRRKTPSATSSPERQGRCLSYHPAELRKDAVRREAGLVVAPEVVGVATRLDAIRCITPPGGESLT